MPPPTNLNSHPYNDFQGMDPFTFMNETHRHLSRLFGEDDSNDPFFSDPFSRPDRFSDRGPSGFTRDPFSDFMRDMEREFFGGFGLRTPGLFDRDPFMQDPRIPPEDRFRDEGLGQPVSPHERHFSQNQ